MIQKQEFLLLDNSFQASLREALLLNFEGNGISRFFDILASLDNSDINEPRELAKKYVTSLNLHLMNGDLPKKDIPKKTLSLIVNHIQQGSWSLRDILSENVEWKNMYDSIFLVSLLDEPSHDTFKEQSISKSLTTQSISRWFDLLDANQENFKKEYYLEGSVGNLVLRHFIRFMSNALRDDRDYNLNRAQKDIQNFRKWTKIFTEDETSNDKLLFNAFSSKFNQEQLSKTDLKFYVQGLAQEALGNIKENISPNLVKSDKTRDWVHQLSHYLRGGSSSALELTFKTGEDKKHFADWAQEFFAPDVKVKSPALLNTMICLWRKHLGAEVIPGEVVRDKFIQYYIQEYTNPLKEDDWECMKNLSENSTLTQIGLGWKEEQSPQSLAYPWDSKN
ncbi:MAG TPA: hypothetical protein VIY47_15465, partial [Ignavibacteriaceae bacterium]